MFVQCSLLLILLVILIQIPAVQNYIKPGLWLISKIPCTKVEIGNLAIDFLLIFPYRRFILKISEKIHC